MKLNQTAVHSDAGFMPVTGLIPSCYRGYGCNESGPEYGNH